LIILKNQEERRIEDIRKTNPIKKKRKKTLFKDEFLLNLTKFKIKKRDIVRDIKRFGKSESSIIFY
jgi:hypothetical protein